MAAEEPNTNNNAGGQTTIIQQGLPPVQMSQAPQGAYVASSQPPAPGVNHQYNASAGRTTGMIQLGCAIASIVLGIADLVVFTPTAFIGTGIWTGVVFFLGSGILGILSAKQSTCIIISYMVMSIMSAIVAGVALAIYSADAAHVFSGYGYYYYYHTSYGAAVTVVVLLLLVALVEIGTAIAASVLCCAGGCCAAQPAPNPVVYYYQVPAGYALPQGMVTFAPQQAPPGVPTINNYMQPPFPAAQYPTGPLPAQYSSGPPPAQWQPMAGGPPPVAGQPPVGAQPPPGAQAQVGARQAQWQPTAGGPPPATGQPSMGAQPPPGAQAPVGAQQAAEKPPPYC